MKKRIIKYSFVLISNIRIVKIAIRFSTNNKGHPKLCPLIGNFESLAFGSLCLDKGSQNPNILCGSFYGDNLSKGILGIQILLVGEE